MATYKVLQDIEAEDKLIGPLTLRQFVYAGIGAFNGYLAYWTISKGVGIIAIVFGPIAIVSLFFAWPWSRDQPTEIWALARLRFLIKPRKRIWDQSGVKELVTITVPKKVEIVRSNGLSQVEVKSRLRALSDTIDSRGWAIKNVDVNMYGQALNSAVQDSDRLMSSPQLPQPVANIDVRAADDMLDVQNNPVAQQFDTMINASAKAHRQQIIERMQQAGVVKPAAPTASVGSPIAPPPQPQQMQPQRQNDYWFLNQPSQAQTSIPQNSVTFNTQVVSPGVPASDIAATSATPTADEENFIKQLKNEPAFSPNMHGHLHVIQPLSAQTPMAAVPSPPQPQQMQPQQIMESSAGQPQQTPALTPAVSTQNPPQQKMTQQQDAAILELARNDDLNVATIAREAHKRTEPPQDEVVISLH